jgi:hypothetical protein
MYDTSKARKMQRTNARVLQKNELLISGMCALLHFDMSKIWQSILFVKDD